MKGDGRTGRWYHDTSHHIQDWAYEMKLIQVSHLAPIIFDVETDTGSSQTRLTALWHFYTTSSISSAANCDQRSFFFPWAVTSRKTNCCFLFGLSVIWDVEMIFFKTTEKQAAICNQDYMDLYKFIKSKNKIIQNSCTTFFFFWGGGINTEKLDCKGLF